MGVILAAPLTMIVHNHSTTANLLLSGFLLGMTYGKYIDMCLRRRF